jgi:hypothetical protein
MKQVGCIGWLVALVCSVAGGCAAQEPASAQTPAAQSGDAEVLKPSGLINDDLRRVQGVIEGRGQAGTRHCHTLA